MHITQSVAEHEAHRGSKEVHGKHLGVSAAAGRCCWISASGSWIEGDPPNVRSPYTAGVEGPSSRATSAAGLAAANTLRMESAARSVAAAGPRTVRIAGASAGQVVTDACARAV